jgi:hypothetical protein
VDSELVGRSGLDPGTLRLTVLVKALQPDTPCCIRSQQWLIQNENFNATVTG